MQQTPSFLPIPATAHGGPPRGSFPRQTSFSDMNAQAGPSRIGDSSISGLSTMMQANGTPPSNASPSSNPHSGFHPGSFGAPLSFSALALGATQTGSSPYSSSMAMSISPPRWAPGSMGGFGSGSFVGSVGALGTSFGRTADSRDRELEAKYVKDFTCCGKQLSGLHELLEHYEEHHAGLDPDVRMAAINAVQSGQGPVPIAKRSFTPSMGAMGHGDAPTTPGMMDIEMDEPSPVTPSALLQQASVASLSVNLQPGTNVPWTGAFRTLTTNMQPPACVPPSVLSYAPPPPAAQPPTPTTPRQSTSSSASTPATPQLPVGVTPEQLAQAKMLKKAQKRAEKQAKEEEQEESQDQPPGEKRFRCPIEGCGKVYKQANGLKYHLTRSINSGHGNVAAMGGLMALLDNDSQS